MLEVVKALNAAKAGYFVLPVAVTHDGKGWSKRPLTPHGHKDATRDLGTIMQWWHKSPGARVGIAVQESGVVVVDVDPRNGGTVPENLDQSYICDTVSGGRHIYFQGETARRGQPWTGVDLKANGFVVAYGTPPPKDALPQWDDDALPSATETTGSGAYTVAAVEEGLPEGERNAGLWWYSCYLRGRTDMGEDEARELLLKAAALCDPPYPTAEAEDMVRRAWEQYAPGEGQYGDLAWERATTKTMPREAVSWGALHQYRATEPVWIVPDVVPSGLTLLAGKRKVGKSWLVGQLVQAVASGTDYLGETLGSGDVLYGALEDTLDRLARRFPAPIDADAGRRLTLRTELPRIDEGLFDFLDQWRASASNPRLVVLDTLAIVRPRFSGGGGGDGGYESAYDDIRAMKTWADTHGIATLVTHHARKSVAGESGSDPLDLVLGSSGLTSAADTVLVLQRDHDAERGTLRGTGRDIEDVTVPLLFNAETCVWERSVPSAAQVSRLYGVPLSEARKWVIAVRQAEDPWGVLTSIAANFSKGK